LTQLCRADPIALISTGRDILTAGTALSGVDVELLDQHDTVASKSHSGNDGKFSVEFPTDGAYRLTVSKKGYSFVPLEMAVKYSPDAKIEFTGSKASISDILVTESEESTTPLLHLCPNQGVFFRAKIESEAKATKIDVQLVHQDKEGERTHSFAHIGTGADATSEIQKLKVPAFFGPTAPHYRLRVNVVDENGNRFSANSREQYTIDMQGCFRKKLAEAIATHQKGNLAGASERYTEAEEYNRIVSDPAPFSSMMQKILFNRGLSDLSTALGMKPGDSRRSALLSKAVQDFNAVIKIRKSNVDALFFRGVLSHLSRSYEAAIQDYSDVILSDPNFPGILKLRALAYIRTGIKKNLLLAIYDLSEALKLNPDDPVLRKTRAETLKAYAADLNKKDDSVVDTSQIQLPNIEEGLNLKKIQQ
jgi:tetratricopeptide (TPR) repeat protein